MKLFTERAVVGFPALDTGCTTVWAPGGDVSTDPPEPLLAQLAPPKYVHTNPWIASTPIVAVPETLGAGIVPVFTVRTNGSTEAEPIVLNNQLPAPSVLVAESGPNLLPGTG